MAIQNNQSLARAAAVAGAPGLNPAGFTYTFTPAACSPNTNETVSITYVANSLTSLFGNRVTIRGTGAMRCGG